MKNVKKSLNSYYFHGITYYMVKPLVIDELAYYEMEV